MRRIVGGRLGERSQPIELHKMAPALYIGLLLAESLTQTATAKTVASPTPEPMAGSSPTAPSPKALHLETAESKPKSKPEERALPEMSPLALTPDAAPGNDPQSVYVVPTIAGETAIEKTVTQSIAPPEIALTPVHFAQATPSVSGLEPAPIAPTPEPPTFNARAGLRYTTPGTGYREGYTSFEGFVPLGQTPNQSLTFLEGRLLLQNNAALGTNLLVGQRFFDPSGSRVFGGYLSYDTRNTGRSAFNQIGVGLETLGSDWDARLNGYFPVGTTRNQVASDSFSGTPAFTPSPTGTGSALLLNRTRLFEAAATGFDLEGGGKLASLGDTGSLWGYGGIYYLSPPGSSDAVGVKARLEARPTDYLNVSLAVQNDRLFDTKVILSLGLMFPGSAPTGSPVPAGLERMSDWVSRQNAIAVADPSVSGQTVNDQVFAINPATGQPLRFLLVNLGTAGGNGSLERPFGTVASATGTAQNGDFVYVQSGTNPGIPAFTIPTGVTVFSTVSPLQVDSVQVANVQLPLRGTGVTPNVVGTVTMGNTTTLSGFNVNSTSGPAVQAIGVTNATIRDNTLVSNSNSAVLLQGTGAISLLNNSINGIGVPALLGTTIQNLTLTNGTNNAIASSNAPIGISLNGVTGTATITSPIVLNNPTGTGIAFNNVSGTATVNALPTSSIISAGAGTSGLSVQNSAGAVSVSGFQSVTNTGGLAAALINTNPGSVTLANSTFNGVTTPALVGTTIGNLTVTNSPLNSQNSPTDGVTLNTVNGTVAITNSPITVTTPANSGVSLNAVNGSVSIASPIQVTTPTNAGILVSNIPGKVDVNGVINITGATPVGVSFTNVGGITSVNGASGSTIANATTGATVTTSPGTVNLSGFQITGSTDGVLATNSGTVNLSRLQIPAVVNGGITSTNVANLSVQNSTVNGGTSAGVLVNTAATVNLTGNTVNGTTIAAVSIANSGTVTGSNNTFTGTNVPALQGTTIQSVNLSTTTLTGNNAPALVGTAVQNLTLDNTMGGQITSTASPTNGITLTGSTGTVAISSPFNIQNPANNGILLDTMTGTTTIAAASGSPIFTPVATSAGIFVLNTPGAVRLSGFRITGPSGNQIDVTPSGNVTLNDIILF